MNKILLDTNILVYSKDSRSVFHSKAQELLATQNDFFVTSKNLSEYYAVVTKGLHPIVNSTQALEDVKEFSEAFTVLYPSSVSWRLLFSWLERYKPTGLKIHDFEIASIGKAAGVDRIATLNEKDFPSEIISIVQVQ